jgi:large conductance mechanosensitive channel
VFKGFAKFIMRGNVVDLAVAVVLGAAFGAVVTSLVKNLLTPLIAAIVGTKDFSGLTFTIHNSRFLYGDFINALVSFVLVAAAVYYFIVAPINAITKRLSPQAPDAPPKLKECPECLSEIPEAARRCKFCTATLATGTTS